MSQAVGNVSLWPASLSFLLTIFPRPPLPMPGFGTTLMHPTVFSENSQSASRSFSWESTSPSTTQEVFRLPRLLRTSTEDTPVDCGDYVIVTNSRKIVVTGRKREQLLYRKHSMFPGGLKETPYQDMMIKKPDEVLPTSYIHCIYNSVADHSPCGFRDVAKK